PIMILWRVSSCIAVGGCSLTDRYEFPTLTAPERIRVGNHEESRLMYQKIYVAVDSSAHARQAADLAIALGHLFGAQVVSGHVDESDHAAERRQRLQANLNGHAASVRAPA